MRSIVARFLHHLARHQGDALAQKIGVLCGEHLADIGAHSDTAGVGHRGFCTSSRRTRA
jgi:hypothetical protein